MMGGALRVGSISALMHERSVMVGSSEEPRPRPTRNLFFPSIIRRYVSYRPLPQTYLSLPDQVGLAGPPDPTITRPPDVLQASSVA
jgi:hypothetical protein